MLTFNDFGMGRAADNQSDKRVYEQSIGLDAFSNMTSREGVHWDNQIQFSATYTNGRKNPVANESLTFDAAGQMTHSGFTTDNYNWQDTVYDAAGRAEAFYGSARFSVYPRLGLYTLKRALRTRTPQRRFDPKIRFAI